MKVINIGISSFYDALAEQGVEVAQIDWKPPVKINDELANKVKEIMASDFAEKMNKANDDAVNMLINADPVWVGVDLAGNVIEGLDDYTVTHSGPPISFDEMVMLHKRGMVSACLFEGWAKTEEEALELSVRDQHMQSPAQDLLDLGPSCRVAQGH